MRLRSTTQAGRSGTILARSPRSRRVPSRTGITSSERSTNICQRTNPTLICLISASPSESEKTVKRIAPTAKPVLSRRRRRRSPLASTTLPPSTERPLSPRSWPSLGRPANGILRAQCLDHRAVRPERRGPRQAAREPGREPDQRAVPVQLQRRLRGRGRRAVLPEHPAGDPDLDQPELEPDLADHPADRQPGRLVRRTSARSSGSAPPRRASSSRRRSRPRRADLGRRPGVPVPTATDDMPPTSGAPG